MSVWMFLMNVWDIGMKISIFGINFWVWTGTIIAFLTYFPLWKEIKSDSPVDQHLLTWALWAVLDVIAAGAIIVQGGNFLLVALYAFGGSTTAYLLWKKKSGLEWTGFNLKGEIVNGFFCNRHGGIDHNGSFTVLNNANTIGLSTKTT